MADLNDWFTGIHAFTQAEHNALASIADALTRHDETTAMQEFRNWGPASSLRLTEAQGELVLSRAVPDVTANAIPHDIVQDMAGTRELAVLYSLAYNAIELVGNKLETAIINDDRASAWYEIRYQSNDNEPQFLEGIAKRRYAESQYFGLYDDAAKVSETDARETFRMFTLHEDIIRNYDHNHDAQIGRANSDYRLGGTDRVQTRVEAFEAAKLVLAQSYVQPFGHTAADIDEVYIDSDTNIIDRTPADKTAGRDLIFGEGGADRISGGTMDDIIYGDFGSAPLDRDGGAGDDTLDGDEGKDTLIGGFGADMLEGGTESDLLVGDAYMAMSDGGDGNDTLVGNEGDDTLLGGGGDDSLEGGADNDVLYGGLLNEIPESTDGDDTLDGGGGADQLFGGAGGDRLYGGAGEDVLSGGQEASFPSYTDVLYGGAGTDHFVCWGSEVIVDAEANETLTVAGLTPTGGSWQYIGKERTGGESEYADLYGWVGQYGEIYQLVYAEIDGQEDAPVLGIAFYDRIGEYTDDWVPMHGIAIRGWVDDVGFMGINLDGDYWENSLTLDVEDLLGGSAPVPRITGESGVPSAAGVGSLFTAPLQMSDVVTVGPDVIVV